MKNVTLDTFKKNTEKNSSVKVVGLKYTKNTQKGRKILVRLLPDNNNPYDKDAIKVVSNEGLVGYVANNKKLTLKDSYYDSFKSASDLRKECKFSSRKYYGILDVKGTYGLMKINI